MKNTMSTPPKTVYLLAFGELFLKSHGVQRELKERLLFNLRRALYTKDKRVRIVPKRERILVFPSQKNISFFRELSFTPGINWFAKAFYFNNYQELKDCLKTIAPELLSPRQSFRITLVKDASVPFSSREIIKDLAGYFRSPVNLDKPNKEFIVEFRRWGVLLYFRKYKGIGGLPVGTQGKGLVLMSGGIDSPVASFLMSKRGLETVWVHFHSFPLVSTRSIEKVEKLAELYLRVQPRLKVYFVSIADAQLTIKREVPEKLRVLVYRWYMYKLASRIAKKEGCEALITGDSLGQVSSQTLTNIRFLDKAVNLPILRPLVGLDKQEIIEIAQKIGSFEISKLPQEDCCSLFVARHSTARVREKEIVSYLKNLSETKLIRESLKALQTRVFET